MRSFCAVFFQLKYGVDPPDEEEDEAEAEEVDVEDEHDEDELTLWPPEDTKRWVGILWNSEGEREEDDDDDSVASFLERERFFDLEERLFRS